MANDFSDAVALFNLDNGALVTDSAGSNTLTNSGVTADTVNFVQGDASGDFEADDSDVMSRLDGDLSADFPYKSGSGNLSSTIGFCMRCESLPDYTLSKNMHPVSKGWWTFEVSDERIYAWLPVATGAEGAGTIVAALTPGAWYRVHLAYDAGPRAYRFRIWSISGSSLVGEVTGTLSQDAVVNASTFKLGSPETTSAWALPFDGQLDEVVIWDRALSQAEMADAEGGSYSPPGASSSPSVSPSSSASVTPSASVSTSPSSSPSGGTTVAWPAFWASASSTGEHIDPILPPTRPLSRLTEFLDWSTGIMAGASGSEQRMRRRAVPRQLMAMTFVCYDEAHQAKWSAVLHKYLKRLWAVPIWPELEVHTASIAAGATTISVDTANADFRADSRAIIWQGRDSGEIVHVDTVSASQLALKVGTGSAWSGKKYVMPCRLGYVVSIAERSRLDGSGGGGLIDLTFAIRDNAAVTGHTASYSYDGYEVLTTPAYYPPGGWRHSADGHITILDSASGRIEIASVSDFNRDRQPHGWLCRSKAEAWSLRQFLHAVYGPQKAFLVPTFRRDFELISSLAPAATTLDVVNRGVAKHMGLNAMRTYVGFRSAATDTITVRKVTGVSQVSSSVERLTIDAAVGAVMPATALVCWVDRCRLAGDRLAIDWHRPGVCTVDTELRRIQQ